jgi:hypothetical protein
MITDGIEVRLQSHRLPALVGTMPEPFTRAGKAILLPSGSDLTARVDTWLTPQITHGQIADRLEHALTESR